MFTPNMILFQNGLEKVHFLDVFANLTENLHLGPCSDLIEIVFNDELQSFGAKEFMITS